MKSKGFIFAAGFIFAIVLGFFSASLLDLELVSVSKNLTKPLETDSAQFMTTSNSLNKEISNIPTLHTKTEKIKNKNDTKPIGHVGLPKTNNAVQADSAELQKIIGELNSNEIELVKSWISRINEKKPKELFESEEVDSVWSTVKQSELEYSFYDNTSFSEIATLDSVNCKSSLCRVRISLYGGDKNSVHLFSAWSNPVSMHLGPHEENSESQKLEIYVARIEQ